MGSFKDPEVARDEDDIGKDAGADAKATASSSRDHGVESSSDDTSLDDNYNVYKSMADTSFDEEEAKRVLRKIDLRVVPVLFVTYFLQYLDKSEFMVSRASAPFPAHPYVDPDTDRPGFRPQKDSLNFASEFGLKQGTHLVGQDYSWLSTIFYFGYLIAQFPASYLLQRLPIGRFTSIVTIVWGAIVMTTPACTSFAGIATNRFFLGVTEASVNPAFVLIMSIWYTSPEQPLRLEAYYCTNGLATMFGGLIGYAVGHITTGLPQWMYVFLIFGAISLAWGAVSFVILPDMPSTAKFLTDREKLVAIDRVSRNKQGVKNRHFRAYQAWQCARDPKTWILFVMATAAQVPNSALTSFTSIIVGSFGFDTLGTQYLQIPGGAVQFLALIIGGWVCTKWPQSRCITMMVANAICIIGAGLLVGLPSNNKVSLLLWRLLDVIVGSETC